MEKNPVPSPDPENGTFPDQYPEEESHVEKMKVDSERAPGARGKDLNELPLSYWYSPAFLGSYTAIGISFLAASGGFGLIAPIISYINEDIGPSENILWVSLAWLLLQAITYLIVGRMTDIFGRRWFFIIGSCIGLIGSIFGALAQSVNQLIGAMVFLGIASGIMLCFFWASAEIVPMKYRYLANVGTYIFSIPTNPLAAKVAYWFQNETKVKWRGCFYFEIVAHVAAIACWYFFYHPPTYKMLHRRTGAMELVRNFDWVGLILWVGSSLIFLMGLSWGGQLYPWNSAYVIGTLVAGASGTMMCVLWELKLPLKGVKPFFPIHLFRNGRYMAVSWLTGFASCNYYAFVLLWPAAVINIYDVEGDYQSTMFALPAMSFVFGQIAGGIIANYTGPKLPTIILMIIAMPLLGAAATDPLNMSMTMAFVITGCFAVGAADSIAITTTTFPIRSQDEIGTAGGLSGFLRLFVSTVSVAVYSTVLANRLTMTLPAQVAKAVANTGLPNSSIPALVSGLSGTSSLKDVPGITEEVIELGRLGFRDGHSQAIRTVFLTNLAFCGVAVILSFFVANNDESKENFVAGHIHNRSEEQALEQQED